MQQIPNLLLRAQVQAVERLAEDVIGIDLVPGAPQSTWPAIEAGAHIDVHLENGLVRQYSIYEPTPDGRGYRIAVQYDAASRGGSAWLHQNLHAGDSLLIGAPRNAFPLVDAKRYLFIAGGIGITPIVAMLHEARARRSDYRLYYCTRNAQRTAFREVLAKSPHVGAVNLHHDDGDPSRALDLNAAIGSFDGMTELYCCGPSGLMDAVRQTAFRLGWPQERLHFEDFKRSDHANEKSRSAFHIRIASTDDVFQVSPDQTVLDVLRENDFVVDTSCEQGLCGTCRIGVLAGIVDHRDDVLSTAERTANSAMTVCCSRALSDELVLDL